MFNKVRIVGDNPVGIHGTSDFVEALAIHLVAGSGDQKFCELFFLIEGLFVATVAAPEYDFGAFDLFRASGSDDSGYHDQLAHRDAVQIAQHSWLLI